MPPLTTILPFCISFSFRLFWSLPPVQCYKLLSIFLQAFCLSDLTLEFICHFHCITLRELIRVTPEWPSGLLPYFLQFKSEFGNKEFMIWVTFSSQSCFCWVYRVSPCLAAKNIITLISILTIRWCPCVELYLVLGFPGGSNDDKSSCKAEDLDLVPGQQDPLDKGMATQSSILA